MSVAAEPVRLDFAIPEYGLINLERASVVVRRSPGHTEPIGGHHAHVTPFGRDADITSTVVDGRRRSDVRNQLSRAARCAIMIGLRYDEPRVMDLRD